VTDLAPVLQGFFTDRLARQKKASPNTVAAYRDTCRLLLAFAQGKTGKAPSSLSLADLDAALIGEFLQHLQEQRGNGSATRNARLAAVRSLFKYAAPRAPEHAAVISQVLAIPPRRRERAIVSYLTPQEADALIAAPGRQTWHGRRDHALLLLGVQTGLRVSELTGLARQDIHLGAGPHVRCHGKGRKDRATPLTTQTVKVMRTWLAELSPDPAGPLFPAQPGGRLSRDAVERLVAKHAATAADACPSVKDKHVTPHTLRHTAAMTLQGRGVASDATFRRRREAGAVRAAGLRAPGLSVWRGAGHAAGPAVLAPGCAGWQDAASRSVALGDRLMRSACRRTGAGWGHGGGRWRWSRRTARCRCRRVRRCWRRCWRGGGASSRPAG
jgi:site-specific recombinase XerD